MEEAIRRLTDKMRRQESTEKVNLVNASGRITAEDIRAPFSVPSYPKSAMDGYAVISEDVTGASKEAPVHLRVTGQINAGDPANFACTPGTAVRIMTGAEVPAGYDAVIRQEDTDYGADTVAIYTGISKWQNYCRPGEDIEAGTCVIPAGTMLTPAHISVIASLGIADFRVLKPMRTAILSTGSELLEPGLVSDKARTYNSTVYQLQAALTDRHIEVVERGHAPDTIDAIGGFLKRHIGNVSVIITTGGVSVGDKDLMPAVLAELGCEILFRGANIKPGTPVTAGYKDGTVILCCSGNPFACVVNFQVFFWPMAAAVTGCFAFLPKEREVTLMSGYSRPRHLRGYLRARCDGDGVYIPDKGHSSSIMSSAVDCNCMVIQPEQVELKVGDRVRIRELL